LTIFVVGCDKYCSRPIGKKIQNMLFQCEFEYSHFSIFSEVHSKNFPIFWVGKKTQRCFLKNITGYSPALANKIGNKKSQPPHFHDSL
jgi:hypothetical protein